MKEKAFDRVILYARHHRANEGVTEALFALISLLKTLNIETTAFEETCQYFPIHCPCLSQKELGKKRDLMIVVGGDGSMLSAGRMAMAVNVPVIGVNRGKLGFLTDLSPRNMADDVKAVLSGHYIEEKRFLLEASMPSHHTPTFMGTAVNDVVLSRDQETQLVEFDMFIDQEFAGNYRADGMIAATPTGSTAYALSAGGPIMHPLLHAIVLVPMFSHRLSSRPIVIDALSEIEWRILKTNEHPLRISCDGHTSQHIQPGETIFIKKTTGHLRLLHPAGYHYYATLSQKLGWEFHHHN